VFQWQGMGFMFLEAVDRADISLLVAYLVVVAAIFVVVNTMVDIIYGFINPTIRIAGRQNENNWQKFKASYFLYSFKRDKVAIFSFVVLTIFLLSAAVPHRVVAPMDPYERCQYRHHEFRDPPGLDGGGEQ
jgi:hypothetical protein